MDLDPEGIFLNDSDSDDELLQERASTKEFSVYLVDASPKMFGTVGTLEEDEKGETFFHAAVKCISESLKAQIIGRLTDEIAICFFNTREKKNIQDLNGVYVFNVTERELLDRPTARLIKEFSSIEDRFMHHIGSRYWIEPASRENSLYIARENSLYNALWVAQALLRKGSVKTVSKRILIFTNEDEPFGNIYGAAKDDMIRTTLQRAKDAQEFGISIELLPLRSKEFDVSILYADLLGLEGDEMPLFLSSSDEKLEDMANQLRKRIFSKRKVKTLMFVIASGVSIEVNAYALMRPSMPGSIMWLDSVTNRPLKIERTFICADTGALVDQPRMRFQEYIGENVKFTVEELAEIKKVSDGRLHLLGFKPLDCLKDYHNLSPSTFIYPTDEEIAGSTCAFVALHRSMLHLQRFAVAFYGSSSHPQLVALVAQDEIISSSGQLEPPGMHMIYLPYSDDIRYPEELQFDVSTPRATEDQIKKASALLRRIDLKDFSVCQFSNPALQRHYGILQALALGEDEMPDVKDDTLPDEEGMARPGVVRAIEEFKIAVYGENHDQEEAAKNGSTTEASKKRKAIYEVALKESATYDWADLAENGKLKDLTVVELKNYLTAHGLPVTGKKEVLISRILTHLGKTNGAYYTHSIRWDEKQTEKLFMEHKSRMIPGFLQILCEYVDANMRSAQGFKDTVYKGVSQKMKDKFGVEVTAEQCKNQLRHQRHLWNHIQELKRKSGVSWDENRKMILIGHEEYMSHIQAFPKDACYLNVPIANYNELEKVCGEGHATGDWAKSSSSQVSFSSQQISFDEDMTPISGDASYETSLPTDSADVNLMEESTSPAKRSRHASQERNVKRKKSKGRVEESIGDYINKMAESVAQVASAMQGTTRHAEERKLFAELMTELSSIPGFSEEEVGIIYDNLSKNPTMIHAFLIKPTTLKVAWMKKELNK